MVEDKIIVQGLEYKNPTRPPLKSIRNFGKPRNHQKWSRHEEYLDWDWNTNPKEGDVWYKNPAVGQLEWLEDEIRRLNYGEWIIIDNVPTYFNKYCYFFHQWHTLQESIYPTYRDTSLEFFRFFEIIDDDPFTLGICGIKGRRLGMSSMAASIQLLICLLEQNNMHGIVSKTNTDAKELYFMIKFSLENLPVFLMPQMKNIGEKELFFGTPVQRISKNNGSTVLSKEKGLNNRAGYLATAENSYDGRRLRTLILDEAAKLEEANIINLFSKISETLVTGSSVVGKVLMFSTINAMDKGGANFKSIWDDSEIKKEGDLETASRLRRLFIEGYRGVLGYTDAFGNSVIDTPTPEQTEYLKTVVDPTTGKIACKNPYIGAKEYRQSRRDLLAKDPEKLAEEIRKFPFNAQEVFKSANNQCYFNTEDIHNRMEYLQGKLEEQGLDPNKDELGRRGWFKKLPSGRVIFVDDPKGLWYVHELLSDEESNKFEFKYGKQFPTNTSYGAAGMDAFANANKTAEKGSNACIMVWKRYTSVNPDESGMPIAMFLGRTNTKREFHIQAANALIYYGIIMGGERAPTDWVDFFYEEKLENYLLTTERKSDGAEIKGYAPQNKQQREEHLTEQIDASLHDHNKINFINVLKDRLLFDIDNRTLYDVSMGSGYALMTLKHPYKKIETNRPKLRYLPKGRIL